MVLFFFAHLLLDRVLAKYQAKISSRIVRYFDLITSNEANIQERHSKVQTARTENQKHLAEDFASTRKKRIEEQNDETRIASVFS